MLALMVATAGVMLMKWRAKGRGQRMSMRRGRSPSPGIEVLDLYARLFGSSGEAFREPANVSGFIDVLRSGYEESIENPSRLHGKWAQDLFEAMTISLDSVRLIKTEDVGDYYYKDSLGQVTLPDFRIVRGGGEQLLVEVKNVRPKDTMKPHKIRAKDVEAEQRYAELTGARLLFAHYWAGLNLWTLVDKSSLHLEGSHYTLRIADAVKANEMSVLGDFVIGTRSPLVMSLVADRSHPRSSILTERGTDRGQTVRLTVGRVDISCGDALVSDAAEQRIATFLMFFGGWEFSQSVKFDSKGLLDSLEFAWAPVERASNQELDIVGALSSMYSARYVLATRTEEGTITRIRHDPDMTLARLIPDGYWSDRSRSLALWKLVVSRDAG